VAAHFVILALASAFSPVLLAIVLVALAAPEPPKLLLWYLAGGGLVSLALGIVIIAALQGLGQTRHHGSHSFGPGVDIAVGVLGLAIAGVLVTRRRARARAPKPRSGTSGSPGPVQRILAKGSPRSMFILGLILGFPGVYYLAALKDIAQGEPNWTGRIALVVAFNVIAFLLILVPLVGFLVAPDATRRSVRGTNAWLGAHLLDIGIVVAAGAGIYELVRGLLAI
jgi:hypothetical protein